MNEVARALQHPEVARLHERLRLRSALEAEPYEGSRFAAVAAIVRVIDEPELLFIKRAEAERDPWSGHIAFPGGRREPSDRTLMDTAIRETSEETSLDLTRGQLIGQLDDLAPRTRSLPPIIVRPYVAVVESTVVLRPSSEVASTFWVPLRFSATRKHRGSM